MPSTGSHHLKIELQNEMANDIIITTIAMDSRAEKSHDLIIICSAMESPKVTANRLFCAAKTEILRSVYQ